MPQVHSKAQKRVPVPEGLDLDTPFDRAAIDKLFAQEMPENLTLATLSFAIPVAPTHLEHHMDHHDSEEDRLARLSSAFMFSDDLTKGNGAYPSSVIDSTTNNSVKSYVPYAADGPVHPGRSAEDNLFYLAPATRQADLQPLSQSLSEAFETKKEKKVKGSKNDKEKKEKKEKRKKTDFNMRDMLPAGAVSSGDERDFSKKEKKSSTRKKGEVRKLYFLLFSVRHFNGF